MTENMFFALCALLVIVSLLGLVAFRLWLDHKEIMEDKEE